MRRRLFSRYIFLIILTLGFCYLFCFRCGVFGAKVDWISQHSVLPDYFRQQFYETGELFPEFAANIGGGQNIYNFAYYGLYNPLLLPSYLLPFVKMSDYMMAVQLLCLIASVLLMYRWLWKRGFSEGICVGTAALFLLAGPMIFHSYNQIMFVNYMPFLLTGLMGVDRYFKEGPEHTGRTGSGSCQYPGQMRRTDMQKDARKDVVRRGGLLTVSIFLMIMTSFYFSIGGMLVLVLYGIHRWLMSCDEKGEKVRARGFLAEGVKFALHFIAAVMMSGILLAPTALALAGRGGEGAAARLGELLLPEVSMTRFCYSPYGIGMTTLAVTALIALMFGRKLYERVLALSCAAVLTIPAFAYLLNGGLYVRDKVMIPFLPLLCYVLAYYLRGLDQLRAEEDAGQIGGLKRLGKVFLPYVITIGLVYMNRQQGDLRKYWKLMMLEAILTLACFFLFILRSGKSVKDSLNAGKSRAWKGLWCNSMILLAPAVLLLAVFGYGCHTQADRALDREFYEEMTDLDIGERIGEATGGEEGFYRTEQLGNDNENAANLNRIWSMGQYSSSIYSSSYHDGYRKFREETFQLEEPFRNFLMQSAVHNPVYQRFMGVKYVVSKTGVAGYEAVECRNRNEDEAKEKESQNGDGTEENGSRNNYEDGECNARWKVYENDQASPVAYGTDRVISEEAYQGLEFPYNQLALLKYAVVKDAAKRQAVTDGGDSLRNSEEGAGGSDLGEGVSPVNLSLPETIHSDTNQTMRINLPASQGAEETVGEKVLFLRFQIENRKPSKDVAVWVEGIRNKLTARNHFYYNDNTEFTYAVPLEDGQDTVEIIFGKGSYGITDVKAYIGILPVREDGEEKEAENGLYQSEFRVNWEKTKGNRIEGTIDAERTGYFITTIPYDENFEILIDGERAEAEEVNTAFLGFQIGAGKHEVSMVYHAPGVMAGKLMSIVGVMILFGMGFWREFFPLSIFQIFIQHNIID